MTPLDVDAATAAILRADWGDRRSWLQFATSQAACRPVVADLDGEVVGTGVGTANGAVGWVGTIWVEPAHRGLGLGRGLTQAVIDALGAAGCGTLVLVSTEEGLPLYQRMGFRPQAEYRILEAHGVDGAVPPTVRPFEAGDLAAMVALDHVATGEDRAHVLERFTSPASAKVVHAPDGQIAGFVVRAPWGGGATVASTIDAALDLLQARRVAAGPGGRVRVGILDRNDAGLATLLEAGLRPIWSAPRLTRGEPLRWRPDWIWGQLNHAIG